VLGEVEPPTPAQKTEPPTILCMDEEEEKKWRKMRRKRSGTPPPPQISDPGSPPLLVELQLGLIYCLYVYVPICRICRISL